MVETVLKVDEVDEVPKEDEASEAVLQVFVEEYVEKEEVKYPLGFLPRPNAHKVYAIEKDDYAFWDMLFGEGRKKQREKWRSLKARMEDYGGIRPEKDALIDDDRRQLGGEINVSCSKDEPG